MDPSFLEALSMYKGKIRIFIGIIVVLFVAVMAVFMLEIEAVKNTQVIHYEMSDVTDGSYVGEASTYLIHVKVKVDVKDRTITNIELLEYQHNRGDEAVDILDPMVKENSTNVDNVSGATQSSILIKAAVSDALEKGVNANDPN